MPGKSKIEPGVLKIMRLGTIIETTIIVAFIILDLMQINILHFGALQLLPMLAVCSILLAYLYIPSIQTLPAKVYALLPVLASTSIALVFPDVLTAMDSPQAYYSAIWVLLPVVSIPLCLVACQYDFWVVAVYVILINLIDVAIHFTLVSQYAHETRFAVYNLVNSMLLRTVSLLFIGYIISTIIQSRRKYESKLININQQMDDINHLLDKKVKKRTLQLENAYGKTLLGWVKVLELRDFETEGHCERVSVLTAHLASKFSYAKDEMQHILTGALLHDIGKLNIPDNILLKPGPLNNDERKIMNQHAEFGFQTLKEINLLRPSLDIIRYHHEKWDGSGYPRGLAGVAIPFSARIFSLVDVWDSLTNDRPYRPAWSHSRAKAYILEQAGIQFDPYVVDIFIELIDSQETDLEHLALPLQRMVTALY